MRTFDRLVSDYMITTVHTVSVDDDLSSAHRRLELFRVSCLVATGRDGVAAGVLSRTDLLRAGHLIARVSGAKSVLELPSMCVGDLMTRQVVSIAPGATVADAGRQMVDRRIHRLFVLDGGRPAGVFSTKESMRAVAEERIADPIAEVMSRPVITVQATDPVGTAINRLEETGVSGLVVLDRHAPAGFFSQTEALAARDLPPQTPVEDAMVFSVLTLPVTTPLFRAAAFAASARARRIVALEGPLVAGILTGLDFAKATAR